MCVFVGESVVFVQVGQLSPYPSVDSTIYISLCCCLMLNCIMLVIKSTLLFDSLSLCEADKIFYFLNFQRKYVSHKPVMSSHLHLHFITRQCTVSILNYNNTLPPLAL